MYKILAIDGGGIKGVIPASFLAEIEKNTNKKIAEHFDLIVGTSTGGILAIALALGISAETILELYMSKGSDIFHKPWWTRIPCFNNYGFFTTKYKTTPLKIVLTDIFKEKKLGECKTRVVVPSFDIIKNNVHIYKTSHNERLKIDYREKVVDIALATSAAPVYFKPHMTEEKLTMVDGGVFANYPVLLSAIEATSVLEWDKENISILSLGCSDELPLYSHLSQGKSGLWNWGLQLIDLMFNSQKKFAEASTKLILNDREGKRVSRISIDVPQKLFGLDKVEMINQMKGLGYSLAREKLEYIDRDFLNIPAKPFEPYHKL